MMKIPRKEHPRPQMQRDTWETLNGSWEFAFDFSKSGIDREFWKNGEYPEKIMVPFCPESRLSGIGFTDFIPAVWYRRTFQIAKEKIRGRVLLHFGAVDHLCRVWINEKEAGIHQGGYSSFCMDITELVTEGENVLVVYAEDDSRNGNYGRGKQSRHYKSHGCFYTRTTGIWQSVWLEFVPEAYISGLKIETDAFQKRVFATLELMDGEGAELQCQIFDGEKVIQEQSVRTKGKAVTLAFFLPDAQLWTPENPHLYDMKLFLKKNGQTDELYSYFGIRTVEWKNHAFYLNGKPVFQRLILDQGFYPEGIYTAPTDQDLIHDIELSKELGFNGARLHEKVFEERFLYHADRLGYLVWGEYGNWGLDASLPESLGIFLPEWLEILKRDRNHPSIIGWCPFNETFDEPVENPRRAQDDEVIRNVYLMTKAVDITRPVIDVSGFYHVETDIYDVHDYEQYKDVFYERYGKMNPGDPCWEDEEHGKRQKYDGKTPLFMSEFGGTFWATGTEYQPQQDSGWSKWKNPESEDEVCDRCVGLMEVLLNSKAFCGYCYTQLTDIEQEMNGLYTYRREKKFSDENYQRIREMNLRKAAIEEA